MGHLFLREVDARLVKASFTQVFARKAELTEHFYQNLFAELPEARAMFHGDFAMQKEMFARVLTTGLTSLGPDASLAELIERMVLKHRHLGLSGPHMYAAQKALVSAFQDVMGGRLSEAELSAWITAMRRLCMSMAARLDE